jgi:WD40 repeat protein
LSSHQDRLEGVSFSDDGKKLVSFGWDKKPIIWDMDSLNLDYLLDKSCSWMKEYLQYGDVSDRNICLDVNRKSQTK